LRALNRLERGQRNWDLLGGEQASDQYVGRLAATFAVACVGAQRSQSASLRRLGAETRGRPDAGSIGSGSSDRRPRPLPHPSPLAIHRFRDRAAGTPTFWCRLIGCSTTKLLGEVIVVQAADIIRCPWVHSAGGARKTRAPDTAGCAAHPRVAALWCSALQGLTRGYCPR
jgi:hypothetical protein